MGPAFAVIGAITKVAGTVMAYSQSRKAGKAAERQQTLSTQRSNRAAIREAQLRRATALNTANQVGAGTSSGIAGGVSSLSSQLGSGLGYSTQMSGLSAEISKYSQRAQLWGDIAKLGSMTFDTAGGMDGVKSFFAKPTPASAFVTPHAARIGA